ncbi:MULTISPECIES: TetR/AcrR family transcriptional regulator C-terminal domain-containing protein [unclassified Luteococcus]|uniref:TetR/AcrR family transcriptional regulator C-terminal domain-containing protein n=1 Tax=unclassified Luteococcus TaxID=2639923 RepID=UPI00313DD106
MEQITSPARRPGRPSAPVLSRERITAEALRMVTDQGSRNFSLNGLARALGVRASALYNHASSKAVVMMWMQEQINTAIDVDCFARQGWREALLTWARSYREAYAPFPMLAPVMAVQPVADAPVTLAMYEAVLDGLLRAGWQPEQAVDVIVAVEAFVFGSALDLDAPADIFEPGSAAEAAPRFTAAARARLTRAGSTRRASDDAFELGLRALVGGLQPAPVAHQED